MKYSTEEALEEIEKRSRKIQRAEDKKKSILLTLSSFVLMLGLVVVIGIFGGAGNLAGAGTAYGSFFVSAEGGAYILTAIAAFVAGVLLTLLLIRVRKKM